MKNKIKIYLIKKLLGSLDLNSKHELLTLAVKKSFNTISEKDILQKKDGKFYYQDKPLLDEHVRLMVSETVSLQNMKLWQVIQTEIQYQANKQMFLNSKSEQDLIAGKFILYTLDIIKSVLNKITLSKKEMLK